MYSTVRVQECSRYCASISASSTSLNEDASLRSFLDVLDNVAAVGDESAEYCCSSHLHESIDPKVGHDGPIRRGQPLDARL